MLLHNLYIGSNWSLSPPATDEQVPAGLRALLDDGAAVGRRGAEALLGGAGRGTALRPLRLHGHRPILGGHHRKGHLAGEHQGRGELYNFKLFMALE